MTRKIIKIGTSEGVTIPKEIKKELNLKIGDELELELDKKNKKFSYKISERKNKNNKRDKELINWTDEFIKEYGDALDELADK